MYNQHNTDEEKRLTAMKFKILQVEKENSNTNEKTNAEMVEIIRKIIKDEAFSRVMDNEFTPNQKDE